VRPRRALVGGAGHDRARGALAEATIQTTYCSNQEGYGCAGTQIGDAVTNDIARWGGRDAAGGLQSRRSCIGDHDPADSAITMPRIDGCADPLLSLVTPKTSPDGRAGRPVLLG